MKRAKQALHVTGGRVAFLDFIARSGLLRAASMPFASANEPFALRTE
jgi:hypothetical protein